jgi:phosphohistidine phosphatase
VIEDRVYAASGRQLLEVVQGLPDDEGTVALVGHNPGLEELVALLTGEWVPMPTSALALVELSGPWAAAGAGSGTLRASGRPPAGTGRP